MQKTYLYQIDSKGKIREWNIEVVPVGDGTYNIVSNGGIQGGKMIQTVTNISTGLNIGKSNETTTEQQAINDAQTEINKKIKKGYVADIAQIKTKGETLTIKAPAKGEVYHPTGKNKALTLDKAKYRGKKVGIQYKLDGWRFRIHITRTDITYYTSGGDVTLEFPQISQSLRKSFDKIIDYVSDKYGVEEYYLDGEIYNHELGFQATASACGSVKNITPEKQALRDAMHFYIFDVCLDTPYSTRRKVIEYFYTDVVKEVVTEIVDADESIIEDIFNKALSEGYEGLIIRDMESHYEYKKSKQFLKYKPVIDKEFMIVGFNKSISGETLGSFECIMEDGRTFSCNLKDSLGTDKMRKEIWDNQQDYIKKFVTVEFLEYTKDGKPRLPRAKAFRKGQSID